MSITTQSWGTRPSGQNMDDAGKVTFLYPVMWAYMFHTRNVQQISTDWLACICYNYIWTYLYHPSHSLFILWQETEQHPLSHHQQLLFPQAVRLLNSFSTLNLWKVYFSDYLFTILCVCGIGNYHLCLVIESCVIVHSWNNQCSSFALRFIAADTHYCVFAHRLHSISQSSN